MSDRVRPRVHGKFIDVGDTRFWIRGVTYGTFRPGPDGTQFPDRAVVERDFAAMAAAGFTAVRTYTLPPVWLLDAAAAAGLRVLAGMWWPNHVAFLDELRLRRQIVADVRQAARRCAAHPALLALAIANEIPAPIVRWHGRDAVARFLRELYDTVKTEDAGALVTYVNYPTTEYLDLSFLDLLCFNVYLESRDRLTAYLARLQNLAGDRPLVMGELGLDSVRHGETAQAESLAWQLETTFEAGAAGAFVFAWTDEWSVRSQDIEEWDFGITRRDRTAKPALAAVSRVMASVPFPADEPQPLVSVVVCSYNGARTIRQTLEGLRRLDYPKYEVIVVDDGSTDATPSIATEYGVRLISGPNRGLSHARNVGMRAAQGEIVAYIDDDAWPDRHWLTYLVAAFNRTPHAAIGGPNMPPRGDGDIAACVANAPGGPIHVLVSDTEAEHIPGCNMAFRRTALESIGGFDEQFRKAGDDVDVCWRLTEAGMTIGFSPTAVVWHHRRNSVGAYVRQQRGYGEAEALLERKWPQKYNALGHVAWAGRLYGGGVAAALAPRARIYHGTWGAAPFQSVYHETAQGLAAFALTPEWYLLLAALAGVSLLGLIWKGFALALPLAVAGAMLSVARAARGGLAAKFDGIPRLRHQELRLLTAWLHLVQPWARLRGRLDGGLTPWRRYGARPVTWPQASMWTLWTMQRREPYEWLRDLEDGLRRDGLAVTRGGAWDNWDLQVRGGALGAARVLLTNEEHGAGRQLVRLRVWPRALLATLLVAGGVIGVVVAAGASNVIAELLFGAFATIVAVRAVADCGAATAAVRDLFSHAARAELRAARSTATATAGDDRRSTAAERAA